MAGDNTGDTSLDEFGIDLAGDDLEFMDPHDRKALEETGGLTDTKGELALRSLAEGDDDDGATDVEDKNTARVPAPPPPAAKTPAPAPAPSAAEAAAAALAAEEAAAAGTPAPAPTAAPAAEVPSILGELPEISIDVFQPKAPADAAAKIEAAHTAESEALAKMMDGSIEPAEYTRIKRESQNTIDTMRDALADDRAASTIANSQVHAGWKALERQAHAVLKAAGLDMKTGAAELADMVQMYGNQVIREGLTDGNNLHASRVALERATNAMLRINGKTAAPAAAPTAPVKPTNRNRVPDLSGLPPNIHAAPAAALPGADGDAFAALDGLNDEALEIAVAGLSDSDRAKYLGT